MSCDRGCHTIGGPWIDFDPSCPVHGSGGTQDQENDREALENRVTQLEDRMRQLEEQLREI